MSVAAARGRTHLVGLSESGALRARLPRVEGSGLEAVLVNTAGGVACGDVFSIAAEAGEGASLTIATPAAEKVYRSDGAMAEVTVRLTVGAGGNLHWLPQETILFDQARLTRRYAVDLSSAARFLSFEAVMFGRAARGEAMVSGHLSDHWRIRRDGDLVFADAFRLSGSVAALLARPTVAAGRGALATCLYVAPDAEARLEEARALLNDARSECGASAWNGLLAVRWLAQDIETLRRDAGSFLIRFRGTPLPRVWGS
ncbi:urease accessory protein UreD [Aquabacter spiritensis]|uniref:urease accessory protein UreD n=1 Tax=Aquabacter spiritensis TaxID=933073 RepID=UPI0030841566